MFVVDGARSVKFNVEVIYESAQVERYLLTAGSKVMKLEKRLLEKRPTWKILETNFQFAKIDEDTVRNLHIIYERIDEVRTGKIKGGNRMPFDKKS